MLFFQIIPFAVFLLLWKIASYVWNSTSLNTIIVELSAVMYTLWQLFIQVIVFQAFLQYANTMFSEDHCCLWSMLQIYDTMYIFKRRHTLMLYTLTENFSAAGHFYEIKKENWTKYRILRITYQIYVRMKFTTWPSPKYVLTNKQIIIIEIGASVLKLRIYYIW